MKKIEANWSVLGFVLLISMVLAAFGPAAHSQATISTGAISGTVTDPSGASVAGARVTITNKDTSQVLNVLTTSAGTYNASSLIWASVSVIKRWDLAVPSRVKMPTPVRFPCCSRSGVPPTTRCKRNWSAKSAIPSAACVM